MEPSPSSIDDNNHQNTPPNVPQNPDLIKFKFLASKIPIQNIPFVNFIIEKVVNGTFNDYEANMLKYIVSNDGKKFNKNTDHQGIMKIYDYILHNDNEQRNEYQKDIIEKCIDYSSIDTDLLTYLKKQDNVDIYNNFDEIHKNENQYILEDNFCVYIENIKRYVVFMNCRHYYNLTIIKRDCNDSENKNSLPIKLDAYEIVNPSKNKQKIILFVNSSANNIGDEIKTLIYEYSKGEGQLDKITENDIYMYKNTLKNRLEIVIDKYTYDNMYQSNEFIDRFKSWLIREKNKPIISNMLTYPNNCELRDKYGNIKILLPNSHHKINLNIDANHKRYYDLSNIPHKKLAVRDMYIDLLEKICVCSIVSKIDTFSINNDETYQNIRHTGEKQEIYFKNNNDIKNSEILDVYQQFVKMIKDTKPDWFKPKQKISKKLVYQKYLEYRNINEDQEHYHNFCKIIRSKLDQKPKSNLTMPFDKSTSAILCLAYDDIKY